MNGLHYTTWIFMALLLATGAFAADGCFTSEPCTWWAYDTGADAVNITILYPNGTVAYSNATMEPLGSGYFNYTITPTVSGNWVATSFFFNNTTFRGTSSESKQIYDQEGVFLTLSIIIGLIALGAFLIYTGKDFMKKNDTPKKQWTLNVFTSPKTVGTFLYLASSWVLVGILGFIVTISQGKPYEALTSQLFVTFSWVVAGFNIGYMAIYLLFKIKESLTMRAVR
jgi:hypothetical protein